jgi:putative heme-binding domain-containing protein
LQRGSERNAWRFDAAREVLSAWNRDGGAASKADEELIRPLLEDARKVAGGSSSAVSTRIAAIAFLGTDPFNEPATRAALINALASSPEGKAQNAAANSLCELKALKDCFGQWRRLPPSSRRALITAALERAGEIPLLLDELEKAGSISELSISQREHLKRHSSEAIRELAARLLPGVNGLRKAVLEQFRPALALQGNAVKGGEVFGANCATCHSFHGQGFAVGPNLAALTDKSPEFLLTSIIEPNAAVDNRYLSYTVTTTGSRELTGLITDESASALIITAPGGARETVLRKTIQSIRPSNLSLMPEGLEQNLAPQQVADLIAYLQLAPAKFGSATPAQAREALARFEASATPFRIVSATESLPYPGWLGVLPLKTCRQTDGTSTVEWEVTPRAGETSFTFPAALGFLSQPAGSFELLVNGKPAVKFNTELDDHTWASADDRVKMKYTVMEANAEDSNGVLSIQLAPELARAGSSLTFAARGNAAGSQRWFGLYELPRTAGANARSN